MPSAETLTTRLFGAICVALLGFGVEVYMRQQRVLQPGPKRQQAAGQGQGNAIDIRLHQLERATIDVAGQHQRGQKNVGKIDGRLPRADLPGGVQGTSVSISVGRPL